MASSVVPTGLRMNGSEKLTESIASLRGHVTLSGERRRGKLRVFGEIELGLQRRRPAQPRLDALHREIDDRRGVKREQLAQQQSADDGDAERIAQLRAGALLERERNSTEQRRQRGHHDRPEPQQRRLHDRLARRETLLALRLEGEV